MDDELKSWGTQWRADTAVPPDLHARVKHGTRRMQLGLLCEVVVTLVFSIASVSWLTTSEPYSRSVFAVVWVSLVTAWVFSLANRRGIWRPATATTAAFLALSILRAERRLQAMVFSAVLYIVVATLFLALGWARATGSATPPASVWVFATSTRLLIWWTATAICFLVMAREYRKTRTEQRVLATLQRQLSEGDIAKPAE